MPPRLYLDNAATSFPKPPEVLEAMTAYAQDLGASAGRGAYREALETGEILDECRRRLAGLLHAKDPRQCIFTLNCSAALNLALRGLLRAGDHVVTTAMEHNSVLRPLHDLRDRGLIDFTVVDAGPDGRVGAERIRAAIRPSTRLITLVHASNVTGTLQPVAEIGAEARRCGALLLVDAAQSAGHVPIDVEKDKIDLLALPGHKGLLGPLGTGALYIRPGLEADIHPLMAGGTGSASEQPTQPDFLPDKYEAGSHNAIGLAGLGAALQWLETKSVAALANHDRTVSARFIELTRDLPGLTVYGPTDPAERVAVFSVRISSLEPGELSALLESEFGILSRSGLHCAPLAHQAIGTYADGGTTRLSFGAFNTLEDVDRCADALRQLAGADIMV